MSLVPIGSTARMRRGRVRVEGYQSPVVGADAGPGGLVSPAMTAVTRSMSTRARARAGEHPEVTEAGDPGDVGACAGGIGVPDGSQ